MSSRVGLNYFTPSFDKFLNESYVPGVIDRGQHLVLLPEPSAMQSLKNPPCRTAIVALLDTPCTALKRNGLQTSVGAEGTL